MVNVAPTPAGAATEIRIRGTVQGVGFRPMVYQLAIAHGLRGEVYNDGTGVVIRVAGPVPQLDQFLAQLQPSAPPLARIDAIEACPIPLAAVCQTQFEITTSRAGPRRTQIAPDAATCPQCLADSLDPDSRFYRYPFTNCTHCGPRLSIVRAIPYDRRHTSMARFPLCPVCQQEYDDPRNRRFHAQPVACPRCGPRLWLERADGGPVEADGVAGLDELEATCALIQQGEIVAVKGLGGIHLACDATNEAAVSQLRQRKHRYHKPFALMVRDLAVIEPYCEMNDEERRWLASPAAPIVLLRRKDGGRVGSGNPGTGQEEPAPPPLAPSLAPHLPTLGVMLPYTPLHHLMLRRMDRPIVLTSGNRSDDPQCIDNDEARQHLQGIARYFLFHDRAIVNRVDDSVVRVVAGQPQTLRRARGYAPAPLPLPEGFQTMPPVLALGGELKSTFCLGRRGEAILSQHLGDLENPRTFEAYQNTLQLYQDLFEHQPAILAADLHPNYRSTQLAQRWAQQQHLPLYGIQHHHAHIAAAMVEQGLPLDCAPVLGIALDGLGYGLDGGLWGGEVLKADYRSFRRLAWLQPTALLGGVQAIRQPWRNTYAHLVAALGWETLSQDFGHLELVQFLAHQPRTMLDPMLARGLHSPLASSTGRLFDAVAAALGCCRLTASYEGQGAMELEALVPPQTTADPPYPFARQVTRAGVVLSPAPLWRALLQDLAQGVEPGQMAARFHHGLAQALAELAIDLAQAQGLSQVVLAGGVFQNQVLLTSLADRLGQAGLVVFTPHQVPPNDGGLSLGQGAIATARWAAGLPAWPNS
ncbi:MAG TPA: carbamoyltransferase HypF [Leptolyngbyaceae cyanobacterium M65_K2018_010]|nr:carbamoyltransferase HypF [Leptolyngbyaceae cyanobacterium M65_K2018_010]